MNTKVKRENVIKAMYILALTNKKPSNTNKSDNSLLYFIFVTKYIIITLFCKTVQNYKNTLVCTQQDEQELQNFYCSKKCR